MIKLNKISVHYGTDEAKTIALNDVSFKIKKGEFVTIIGKSGNGKTTLLNILGGITKPTKGSFYFVILYILPFLLAICFLEFFHYRTFFHFTNI